MDRDYEIERLRDWKHDYVDPTLVAFKFRIELTEQEQSRLDERLSRLWRTVNDMVEADKIADAVAKKVQKRNKLELTLVQRFAGAIIFGIAVADFLGIHIR